MNGTLFKSGNVARTPQSMVEKAASLPGRDLTHSCIAQVKAVYPEAMTCDITGPNGMVASNVPIMTRGGLEDDEVWGELEVPSIDSYVVVEFIGDRESFPVITGTVIPYANSKYQDSQTPVNSDNKAFTLKLLEKVDPKVYRRIFKSGTSIEVKEDGTILIETPSGSSVQVDEDAEKMIIEHKKGSDVCTLTLDAANGFNVKDKNNNEVAATSSGMQLKDKNGNVVDMGSTSVKINNNFEVLQ